MKLSWQKNIKRLLLATLAATSLTCCQTVYAEGASDNTITVTNSDVTINSNKTDFTSETFNNGNFYFGNIYGGYVGTDFISGISSEWSLSSDYMIARIIGGMISSGNASGNRIFINGGKFYDELIHSYDPKLVVYGGYAKSDSGTASDNIVTINNGKFYQIIGGNGQNAVNNQVIINGGTIGVVEEYDGYDYVDYLGGIIGGSGYTNPNGSQVTGNTITISGGTVSGSVEAGTLWFTNKNDSDANGTVTNNWINVYGNPNLSGAELRGRGLYRRADGQSGNTLNLATQITAQNIYAFDNINFFIPKTMTSGGTMLTLTDTSGTNLSGTAIRAAMQGGSSLDTGDTVNLIQSAGTITTDSSTTYGKMSQAEYDAIKDRLPSGMLSDGVSLNYEMTVEKSGDNTIIARIGNTTTDDTTPTDSATDTTTPTDSATDTTTTTDSTTDTTTPTDSATDTTTPTDSATATTTIPAPITNGNGVNTNRGGHTLPQTELLGGAQIASLKLVDFMSDKLVDWLPPCTFDFEDEMEDEVNLPDVPLKESKGYEVFITGSGGSFRTKTGNGSYIESTLKGFDVGFGRSIDYSNGRLVFAPIFEYATGDYDSYLDDGQHGKGNTKYMAGGLIGRKSFNNGFYIEASARGGKTERDFSSDTMTSNGSPIFVHYDKTSAPVFAGHLRLGRQIRLNKNNLLDYYGIYFHSHQGGMNLNLSTGENYHFSSATSSRTRLGYRLTTRTSKISRIYTGLAFQYEHNPNVVGTYKGRRTPNAGSCGASGMLEFGWMIRPNKDNPWMLDLNATGFVGLQRGLSGTIKLQKEF